MSTCVCSSMTFCSCVKVYLSASVSDSNTASNQSLRWTAWRSLLLSSLSLLWSPYVIGQTIIFSSCFFFLSFFLFFFLALSQRSDIGCLPYFGIWCGLSAKLECRSEMRCTQLAANTGRKKSPSRCHRTTLSGYSFAIKARIDNRKRNL